MADSVAVMISTASAEAVAAALDLVAAAATIEMGAHMYFRGAAVVWFSSQDDAVVAAEGEPTRDQREAMLSRLRTVKDLGDVKVYACSRAMTEHGITAADVPPEVDSPAGMATFLSLARKATLTLNF
jgi:peroxiredoxin family protein